MRRRWRMAMLAMGASLLAGAAGAAVIINPDWARKPTAEEIAFYYPKLAGTLGVEGRAWLHCGVTIEGAPSHCVIVSESPAGLGFGDAALAMAPTFRFSPRKVDGRPAEGGTVNIPIHFTLNAPPKPAPEPLPTLAGVDPKKAALARRYAELVAADDLAPGPNNPARRMAAAVAVQGDPASRERLVAAFETAMSKLHPQMLDLRAALAAKSFTTEQLGAIVAFLESDAGRAYRAEIPGMSQRLSAFFNSQRSAVVAQAVEAYCADPGACPPPPPKDEK